MTQTSATPSATLVVEYPNTASLISRIVPPLFRVTVRFGLDAFALLSEQGLVRTTRLFRLTNTASDLRPVGALAPIRGTRMRPVRFDGFDAEWVWHRRTPDPAVRQDAAMLYLHGGAFVSCGLRTHRRLVSRIAKATGVPVLSVAYRQVPDLHPSDSVEDCVTAYRRLLEEGFASGRTVIAGDSAGGFLSFATALALRDRGMPVPAGIVGICPAGDLDNAAREIHPGERTDPIFSARFLRQLFTLINTMKDGRYDPLWSPVEHDFTGMPPALIMVGSTEILRSDAERLAGRYADAGEPCRLQIWDRQVHVFPIGADLLPEGRAAIRDIGAFVRNAVRGNTASTDQPRRVAS